MPRSLPIPSPVEEMAETEPKHCFLVEENLGKEGARSKKLGSAVQHLQEHAIRHAPCTAPPSCPTTTGRRSSAHPSITCTATDQERFTLARIATARPRPTPIADPLPRARIAADADPLPRARMAPRAPGQRKLLT